MTTSKTLEMGVCYGTQGNNLPPPAEVVDLYKKHGIGKMRIFEPNPSVLEALRGSNIEVTIGTLNEDIPIIAASQDSANSWFLRNINPYILDINIIFIVVGNEVIPGNFANFVAPAIQNLLLVLESRGLRGIRVTTAVGLEVLKNSFPPSATEFQDSALGPLVEILKVLEGQGASILMANIYPYFAYAADPIHVSLDYALFRAKSAVVRDGNFEYYNLFSAMVDSFYWAMEKAGYSDIGIAISESGWPSAGNEAFTTPQLASIYNKNFVKQILTNAGTPKRPGLYMDAFIFAMFNENLKPIGIEQNWGLFYPNKQPVYSVFP